jgi:hypothetical protein
MGFSFGGGNRVHEGMNDLSLVILPHMFWNATADSCSANACQGLPASGHRIAVIYSGRS